MKRWGKISVSPLMMVALRFFPGDFYSISEQIRSVEKAIAGIYSPMSLAQVPSNGTVELLRYQAMRITFISTPQWVSSWVSFHHFTIVSLISHAVVTKQNYQNDHANFFWVFFSYLIMLVFLFRFYFSLVFFLCFIALFSSSSSVFNWIIFTRFLSAF